MAKSLSKRYRDTLAPMLTHGDVSWHMRCYNARLTAKGLSRLPRDASMSALSLLKAARCSLYVLLTLAPGPRVFGNTAWRQVVKLSKSTLIDIL